MTIAELSKNISNLRAGEKITLSGAVYTARDAAHKRMAELIKSGGAPFEIRGAVIYYAGPTPAPPGMVIGSCGPTTSGRMDIYTPDLYDRGLLCTIGKGERSPAVYDAIRRNGGLYLCALGGAGALYAKCVQSVREIAFPELGCESIKLLEVLDMPLIVGGVAPLPLATRPLFE